MEMLQQLNKYSTDKAFQAKWAAVKRKKKAQLAALVKKVGQRPYLLQRALKLESTEACLLSMCRCSSGAQG